jgi:hypothetical protein
VLLAESDAYLDEPENLNRGRVALREVWIAVKHARERINREDLWARADGRLAQRWPASTMRWFQTWACGRAVRTLFLC